MFLRPETSSFNSSLLRLRLSFHPRLQSYNLPFHSFHFRLRVRYLTLYAIDFLFYKLNAGGD